MSVTEYNVGPGVQAAMADHGDEARSDEVFVVNASVVTEVMPQENSPKQFQVVYNKTTRMLVGMEPSGGVGPDNSVAVIHDMAEYDKLMATDPAYLSADGDHIVGTPPA